MGSFCVFLDRVLYLHIPRHHLCGSVHLYRRTLGTAMGTAAVRAPLRVSLFAFVVVATQPALVLATAQVVYSCQRVLSAFARSTARRGAARLSQSPGTSPYPQFCCTSSFSPRTIYQRFLTIEPRGSLYALLQCTRHYYNENGLTTLLLRRAPFQRCCNARHNAGGCVNSSDPVRWFRGRLTQHLFSSDGSSAWRYFARWRRDERRVVWRRDTPACYFMHKFLYAFGFSSLLCCC